MLKNLIELFGIKFSTKTNGKKLPAVNSIDKKGVKFEINVLNKKKQILKAEIKIYKEYRKNILLDSTVTNAELYIMEYFDETGLKIESYDTIISFTFQKLYKKLESESIRMLIKGCSLKYPVIKPYLNSFYISERIIGKPINLKKDKKVGIFDNEKIENIVSSKEQDLYLDEWLKSITGSVIV